MVAELSPLNAMGEAAPVTIVPPAPGNPSVPGVKPGAPYSTMNVPVHPVQVKLTLAEFVVIEPTDTPVGTGHVGLAPTNSSAPISGSDPFGLVWQSMSSVTDTTTPVLSRLAKLLESGVRRCRFVGEILFAPF